MAPTVGSALPLERLRTHVGDRHVITDPDVVAAASRDWTGRHGAPAAALVRPGSTEEVAAVVAECRAAGVPVVPQGGNTGLVGGGVPRGGEVLVQLGRLRRLDPVDHQAGQVTAGAGVTLASLQSHAAAAGWRYPVDFGARELATVGGMVATDAGGVTVFRHGSTRRQLRGLEAVLADGSVISRLSGLVKDGVGYDLAGLVCGSEGTLAVITAARLALTAAPASVLTAWVPVDDLSGAIALAARAARRTSVEAIELIGPECVGALVASGAALPTSDPRRERPGWVVLVEAAGGTQVDDDLADALSDLVDRAVVAPDAAGRRRLWALRDAVPEVIRHHGLPLKLDVAVPLGVLPTLLTTLPELVAATDPSARCWRFGHAADGNVHVNLTGPDLGPDGREAARVADAVLGLVLELGGSIAAEHGVGVAKAGWMSRARGGAELAAMARVKAALDPDRVLNPGVLGL